MTRRVLASLVVGALVTGLSGACRTARPDGRPIAPLVAVSADEAMQQLREKRAAFRGARSLMRVRATTNGRTQSFRAQLVIRDVRRMELIAYTPVGTKALTLSADGDAVSIRNHMEGSEWEGDAADLARSIGFLGTSLLPAEVAMLIIGLPPLDTIEYEADPRGLRTATSSDLVVAFDPPSFPASGVVVTRGADRIEIEHLEVVE
ncbi:MAG TPA: hypothetical protein VF701_08150 [Thermoanaerobaculia bacterium]